MAHHFETTLTASDGLRAMFEGGEDITEVLRAIEATRLIGSVENKGFWTIHCYAHDILRFTALRMSIDVLRNGEWVAGRHVQFELTCQARAEVNFDAPEARITIHDNQVMTCMEAIALGLHDAPGVGAARRLIARRAQHPGFDHLLPWGLVDDPSALTQY